jgi:hypothetical protein
MIHKDFRIFEIPPRHAQLEDRRTPLGLAFTSTIVADLAMLKQNDLPTPGTPK